jgi:DNA-binding transcriptional ArsR family regulator
MAKRNSQKFEAWARIAKALAHPARLQMVDELSRGERCVCELAKVTGLDLSTASRHLAELKRAGIVTCRKEGTWLHCRLRCKCILNFFVCVDGVSKANAKAQLALLE